MNLRAEVGGEATENHKITLKCDDLEFGRLSHGHIIPRNKHFMHKLNLSEC